MVQDKKKNINLTISDVTFIGKDLNIYKSLKNLSHNLHSFSIDRSNYSNNLIKNNGLLIIDDSTENLKEKIQFFEKINYNNFFLLIGKENVKILKKEEYKIFFKPLKVFELHKEVCKKISKNIQITKGWKLDRSKLQFYRSNNSFINLTEKEFYFIYFLLQNKGSTVSKEKLLQKVWNLNIKNNNSSIESRVVETMVSKIRKKFKKYNKGPRLIKDATGYKILV